MFCQCKLKILLTCPAVSMTNSFLVESPCFTSTEKKIILLIIKSIKARLSSVSYLYISKMRIYGYENVLGKGI